ncbi:MAG: glycosyltransferase family 2 protein [Sphingobacteriaceae bacterium]
MVVHNIISLFLTGFYFGILVYFFRGWKRLSNVPFQPQPYHTKVSILIAARNEAARIHLTINDILAQKYPEPLFELIVVDDHSTDFTADIIRGYENKGVRLLQLNESEPLNSYKKKALSEAMKIASGDLIVATDADCRMGTNWLPAIVGFYENNDLLMISSPVAFFEEKSLFERLQTLEFSFLIGIGAASIGNGKASTCNGANLAYRKSTFYEVGGFRGIDELASGDDELLLQKVAEKYSNKIGFLKQREAIVYTHAKPDLKELMQQRRRWASKSTKYKDKKVIILAVFIWLFNVSILINLILGFCNYHYMGLFLLQMLVKYLLEIVFLFPILSFLKRKVLILFVLLLSPLHVIYLIYVGIIGNNRKYRWKGRLVK